MKKLLLGNWKMNQSSSGIKKFVKGYTLDKLNPKFGYGLAVPFVYIDQVREGLLGTKCLIGAQNVSTEECGAYTGEVSAGMLKDKKVDFCLVGHSERRKYFNESEEQVNAKIMRLLENNIMPVLCIGETCEEYKAGKTHEVLSRQLLGGLDNVTETEAKKIVVAYEPVWAIGTGITAKPSNIERNINFIKDTLFARFGESAKKMRVLYGGSVKADSASELFGIEVVDGALVGGASLEVSGFLQIADVK